MGTPGSAKRLNTLLPPEAQLSNALFPTDWVNQLKKMWNVLPTVCVHSTSFSASPIRSAAKARSCP